ncbi:MAG: nucleoside hydrolase [Firmicutes bacterium]|nr:nucleoside hydrolase [Bacillota bacterium]
MTQEQYLKNLQVPTGPVDVVLDTDAYNEVDDQFAISYLLHCQDKLNIKGFCAAPFFNSNSTSPENGMERSYDEILKLLTLAGKEEFKAVTYKGSRNYLVDETTPQITEAAEFMVKLAQGYSPEKPLYIVAIGAITNVASALLMDPSIAEKVVIVWLGGHSLEWENCKEFNLIQDVAAARVVFGCGAPVVMLPCMGVVDAFRISGPELKAWFAGKNALCDYLSEYAHSCMAEHGDKVWSRVIWDACTIGWLMNDEGKFMKSRLEPAPLPEYDGHYTIDPARPLIQYVWHIGRDALWQDIIDRIGK